MEATGRFLYNSMPGIRLQRGIGVCAVWVLLFVVGQDMPREGKGMKNRALMRTFAHNVLISLSPVGACAFPWLCFSLSCVCAFHGTVKFWFAMNGVVVLHFIALHYNGLRCRAVSSMTMGYVWQFVGDGWMDGLFVPCRVVVGLCIGRQRRRGVYENKTGEGRDGGAFMLVECRIWIV